jgi:hypothetical protein
MNKKTSLSILVCISILLFSCGKDPAVSKDHLIGKWLFTEETAPDGTIRQEPIQSSYYVQFYADGTYKRYQSGTTAYPDCSGVYQASDYELVLNTNCPSLNSSSTFSVTSTRLIISYPNPSGGFSNYKYLPAP